MTKLSPAAQAVAKAALYVSSCDPKDYPFQAQEIAAAALRAAALGIRSEEYETCGGASYSLMIDVDDLLALADELEAQ